MFFNDREAAENQVKIYNAVKHKIVVAIIDSYADEKFYCMAMSLYQSDLAKLIKKDTI